MAILWSVLRDQCLLDDVLSGRHPGFVDVLRHAETPRQRLDVESAFNRPGWIPSGPGCSFLGCSRISTVSPNILDI